MIRHTISSFLVLPNLLTAVEQFVEIKIVLDVFTVGNKA